MSWSVLHPVGCENCLPCTCSSSGRQRPKRDELRVQERVLLDAWSAEWFFKAGFSAVLLLAALLVLAGAVPTDARCTLPWC